MAALSLAPAEVARLEEGRLARGFTEMGGEFRLLGAPTLEAGAAVALRGEWQSGVVNLGMNGAVVDREELADAVDWLRDGGVEASIELCPHAHPSAMEACAALGFVIDARTESGGATRGFDTVLFRDLREAIPERFGVETPAGLTVERIDPSSPERVRAFVDACLTPASPASPAPPEVVRTVVERCARHPRNASLAALDSGRIVGVGSVDLGADVAGLYGAKTLSQFRRRGVQSALIGARLAIGAAHGARVATLCSRPGGASERNALRLGFRVAYTKTMLVRPGAR